MMIQLHLCHALVESETKFLIKCGLEATSHHHAMSTLSTRPNIKGSVYIANSSKSSAGNILPLKTLWMLNLIHFSPENLFNSTDNLVDGKRICLLCKCLSVRLRVLLLLLLLLCQQPSSKGYTFDETGFYLLLKTFKNYWV